MLISMLKYSAAKATHWTIVLIYKFTSLAIFYTTLKHKLTHAWYMIIGYHVGFNTVRTIVKHLYFGKAEPPGTLKQYD